MKKNELRSDVTERICKKRIIAVGCAFCVFLTYLFGNLFYLQYVKHDYYKQKTYDQITTSSLLKAERGKIYDSGMNVLATDKTVWRIFVSTRNIKMAEKNGYTGCAEFIAKGLSEILGTDEDVLFKKIKNTSQLDVTVKKAADEETYNRVLRFIIENSLEDLVFTEAQGSRYYPAGTLAAHVLGFTGSDNDGLFGLEYYYDETLSGKDGYYLYAKDANGNTLPTEYSEISPAVDGNSIVTTIDSFLQEALETQLENIRINHDVQNRVTGIVMDTSTGAILAMATSSPFDPNSPFVLDSESSAKLAASGYSEDSENYKAYKNELLQEMWSNKAVSQLYEPGSTFKIVTVSAALDSGAAKITDTFSCKGYHEVGGWRIKCHKVTGHGSGFSLAYGLQMSCNPTMMTIAERIGAQRFYSYVEKFGYFEKTGIDLPGEASTIFHKPENIGSTELATASFGQRFKVSVINQLRAISCVANGGQLVTPYLVEKIIDPSGNTVSEHTPEIRAQVIDKEVADLVAKVLEEGVSGDGGAKNAHVLGYSVAAKTGTSQKFDVLDENGNSYLRIGSTVAFTTGYERNISMILVVDEPMTSVKYGSVVAAPYVSAFLETALPYLEYKSTREEELVTVGNYVGMNVNSAVKELTGASVSYKIIGDGKTVISQMPAANDKVSLQSTVVYLYTEDEENELTMPNLLGLDAHSASVAAINLGLNVQISGPSDMGAFSLSVSEQSIPPGEKIKRGQILILRLVSTSFED
ncbi:MAG: PASTA domain-containing protein [Clostridia bacterium]|nr:PASTA domain-containing protein [Clostridia bacterium]